VPTILGTLEAAYLFWVLSLLLFACVLVVVGNIQSILGTLEAAYLFWVFSLLLFACVLVVVGNIPTLFDLEPP
jgi:hypothetical protein